LLNALADDLKHWLSKFYYKEWPWHIRELELGKFLVRFAPHKKGG